MLARLSGEAARDYGHRYVGEPQEPVAAHDDYVRVWLRSARIVDVRRWAQKFYPTVHARFVHADAVTGLREVVSVTSPSKSFQELDSRHLDRFIVVNQPLLGPLPYGGELASEIALFSVASDNLAKPYLDLLSELTASAAGSYLTAVEPLIAPLRRGAEVLLMDPGRAELEIGLARTDTALVAGNIVVARADKGELDLSRLTLDRDDHRLLDGDGQPVSAFPYFVIGIERLSERADFRGIPEIRDGWKRVRDAAQRGDPAETVLGEFRALVRTVNFSPDLVRRDRRRVGSLLADELRQAGYSPDGIPGLAPPLAAPMIALEGVTALPVPERAAVEDAWRPETGRLSLSEARRMIVDPGVPDDVVRRLLVPDPAASRPFAPAVRFNPDVVAVETPEIGIEGAQLMNWANELAGWRRQNQFLARMAAADPRPVLVSVGDSWFQFPLFLADVVDQLGAGYSIWSLDAAGDTLENMVVRQRRHIEGLQRWQGKARALLVSGSGNDIVGEDPDGVSVLTKILRPYTPGKPPEWYLETGEFTRRLAALEAGFTRLFTDVAAGFPGLPVICHGYDHAIPARPGDPRHPLWASQDAWLTGPMVRHLGLLDADLRQAIVRVLIDRLNQMLIGLCGGNRGGRHANAWHVDVRGAVGERWADELHPTDDGFATVGRRFTVVLNDALAAAKSAGPGVAPAGLEAPGGAEVETEARAAAVFAERAEVQGATGLGGAEGGGAGQVAPLAVAPPPPPLSARALDLIVAHETGGRAYYERVYKKKPVWPKGASGVTIGFGYDLGYVDRTRFERDWSDLPPAARAGLADVIGHRGGRDSDAAMQALVAQVSAFTIEWELAEKVFYAATVPRFAGLTAAALPDVHLLSPDSFGALVSLTFNRGASYRLARDPADPRDRYREMRGIAAAMGERRFTDIPGLIRLMKRLWVGTAIEAELVRRREDEAALFEVGLAGGRGGGTSLF